MQRKLIFSLLALLILVAGLYFFRWTIRDWYYTLTRPPLPSAVPYPSATVLPPPRTATPSPALPGEVNLNVPFVVQAPLGVWDSDHEDFCEEASALMAASYLKGDTSVTDPNIADARLYQIKNWEMTTFGYFRDTTAAETARIMREDLNVSKVKLFNNPSVDDIKLWLSQGRLVIVPAAGQLLGNPFYKSPGPLYHMVVIKGYTADGNFIANDAGTRRGADYQYSPAVIMNAMHDWNNGDVLNGAKVVIVVG